MEKLSHWLHLSNIGTNRENSFLSSRIVFSYLSFRYNKDETFGDLYPGPIDGVYTPQPMDRSYTPQNIDMTLNGLQNNSRATPVRPKSSRAQSRADVTLQVGTVIQTL